MLKNKKQIKLILIFVFFIAVIWIIYKSFVLKEIVYLIFISLIIAYTLMPLQNKIVEKGLNKRLSALMIIVFLIFLCAAFIYIIVPSILKEGLNVDSGIIKIQKNIEIIYEKFKPLNNNKTIYVIMDKIYDKIDNLMAEILNKLFDGALNIGQDLLSAAVIPIISYYFMADSDIIFNKALIMFPIKSRRIIKNILQDIDKVLGKYIVGQLLLSVIIGVFTFIILFTLKVDFPVLLSILNAFFNIIPYFGPIFGAVPAVIMGFIKSTKAGIYTIIFLYLLQLIEGNIISPKVTGNSVSMHPLLVIILLLLGGQIGGFIGMIIAVPVGVIVKIIYEDINYYFF
ncbi:AI-2E family transporter [Clostridium sp. JN-9]|uniref:AI-2E family transporter n=1 Tax=Clostridium sp. JN-9 TaxID=2507159 RepID=UPI000FFE0EBD|nr:AI-2E family transporter [Clostridium sp. JN-9]QAT40098.1 AI-2E family transporter [Clostridium sp. JN-9]